MAFKIYIDNNYFVLENTNNNDRIEVSEPRKTIRAYVQDGVLKIGLTSNPSFRKEFKFSELVDENTDSFIDIPTLQTFLRENTGFNTALGSSEASNEPYGSSWSGNNDAATKNSIYDKIELGSSSGTSISQQVFQFSNLVDGDEIGELSYVENSQGTSWLPYNVGGTYYPAGWYVWNGTIWISDRNSIVTELQASRDIKPYFVMIAEETSNLVEGSIQYSYGNGGVDAYIILPFNVELMAVSIEAEGGTLATVSVDVINGNGTALFSTHQIGRTDDGTGKLRGFAKPITSVFITEGSAVAFRTKTIEYPNITNARMAAWFRITN